jgi:hypothetical protein
LALPQVGYLLLPKMAQRDVLSPFHHVSFLLLRFMSAQRCCAVCRKAQWRSEQEQANAP